MSKRHETIGIKQAIRFEWMQKTSNLLLAGLDAKSIRQELHDFLTERKGNGSEGQRSDQTRSFVVNSLMKIWVSPDAELVAFRDASLAFLREDPSVALAVHWGMISAAYPFWFSVARQTGRLLALQDQVTQTQIINRIKEQFGDRQTVSRYARYVIRSLVAWGVLSDSNQRGCYKKNSPIPINNSIAILLLESTLHASPATEADLGLRIKDPGLFPFHFPPINRATVSQPRARIEIVRYGVDREIVKLV